jgi:hypothetical protein
MEGLGEWVERSRIPTAKNSNGAKRQFELRLDGKKSKRILTRDFAEWEDVKY